MNPTRQRRTSFFASLPGWLGFACAAFALCFSSLARATENSVWENAPYRVLATIAVDDRERPQPGLESALAKSIAERVEGSLRPLWKFEISVPDGGLGRRQCFALREIPWDELTAEQIANDKLLWLNVKTVPTGYELRSREFDVHVRRWGPVRESFVQQASFLPEAAFELLKTTFSPLALITPIEGNDAQVSLSFKGSALQLPSGERPFVKAGDAYAPLLRRTDRSGKMIPGGVMPVPWTYLILAESKEAGLVGEIQSGSRRPFGAAKRGLVEQVAIGIGNAPAPTQVRFHARTDKNQGLAGYEVFRAGPNGAADRLGATDRDGAITVSTLR